MVNQAMKVSTVLPLTYGDYYSPKLGPSSPQSSEGSASLDYVELEGELQLEQLLSDLKGDEELENDLLDQLDSINVQADRTIKRFNKDRQRHFESGQSDFVLMDRLMDDFDQLEALRSQAKEIQERLELLDTRKEKAKEALLCLISDLRLVLLQHFSNLLKVDISPHLSGVYDSITGDRPGSGDFGLRDCQNLLKQSRQPRVAKLQTCLSLDLRLIQFAKDFQLSTNFKSHHGFKIEKENLILVRDLLKSLDFDESFDQILDEIVA